MALMLMLMVMIGSRLECQALEEEMEEEKKGEKGNV